MLDNQIYDLIIVGGGPGGLAAGLYAMRAVLKTVLIEKGSSGGQVSITKGVENYPGFEEISGFELSEKFLKHAKSYGLEVIHDEVVDLETGSELHSVQLSNGRVLHAHAVILATGGSPRKLSVPGEDHFFGRGVSYCAKCDGFFFKDKTVVVVGGGDTAAEEALYLAKLATKVYLVHRRDALRASKILQQRLQSQCKVEIIFDTVVGQIRGNDLEVTSVLLENIATGERKEVITDGVFIFVGLHPNNHLVPQGVAMTPEGYVLTDERCQTNIPGIFVIGDLRQKYAKQIVIAAADGSTAALAAAHYIDMKQPQVGACDNGTQRLAEAK